MIERFLFSPQSRRAMAYDQDSMKSVSLLRYKVDVLNTEKELVNYLDQSSDQQWGFAKFNQQYWLIDAARQRFMIKKDITSILAYASDNAFNKEFTPISGEFYPQWHAMINDSEHQAQSSWLKNIMFDYYVKLVKLHDLPIYRHIGIHIPNLELAYVNEKDRRFFLESDKEARIQELSEEGTILEALSHRLALQNHWLDLDEQWNLTFFLENNKPFIALRDWSGSLIVMPQDDQIEVNAEDSIPLDHTRPAEPIYEQPSVVEAAEPSVPHDVEANSIEAKSETETENDAEDLTTDVSETVESTQDSPEDQFEKTEALLGVGEQETAIEELINEVETESPGEMPTQSPTQAPRNFTAVVVVNKPEKAPELSQITVTQAPTAAPEQVVEPKTAKEELIARLNKKNPGLAAVSRLHANSANAHFDALKQSEELTSKLI